MAEITENEAHIRKYLGVQYALIHSYQARFPDAGIEQILSRISLDTTHYVREVLDRKVEKPEPSDAIGYMEQIGRALAGKIGASPEYTRARLDAMEWLG